MFLRCSFPIINSKTLIVAVETSPFAFAVQSDCVRRPIGLRSPSDQIAFAVQSDCVRRPIRRRSLADDFRLGFARYEYGFLCAKTVPVGAFGGFSVVGNRLVRRNVMQEVVRTLVVVDAAAVVLQSVAHHKVVYVQQQVVRRNLLEHLLRYLHRRRLVLHYHARLQVAVVQHAVGAQLLVADAEAHLVSHERGGVALVLYQIVDEVLAHPLLGRERYVAVAQNVEDAGLFFRAR